MSENAERTEPDVPHDDDLDVESPNESAPGHNPPDEGDDSTTRPTTNGAAARR